MLTKLGKALLPTALTNNYFYLTIDPNRVIVLGKALASKFSSYNGLGRIVMTPSADYMNPPSGRTSGYPSSGSVLFGSGTTPPTENDTDVESLISNISVSHSSASTPGFGFDSEKAYLYIDYTIANNNSSSITVSEVCLYFVVLVGGNAIGDQLSTSTSNWGTVLFSRSLVDNPVTIAAGESGIVRVKFELN